MLDLEYQQLARDVKTGKKTLDQLIGFGIRVGLDTLRIDDLVQTPAHDIGRIYKIIGDQAVVVSTVERGIMTVLIDGLIVRKDGNYLTKEYALTFISRLQAKIEDYYLGSEIGDVQSIII